MIKFRVISRWNIFRFDDDFHWTELMTNSKFEEQRLEKNPSIVFRQIADETILVPIYHKTEDLSSVFTVNEVGSLIWELIDGEITIAGIRDRIVEEFEIGMQEAEDDLAEFLKQLEEADLLKGP